jgi:mono/diheme cytochrome c family protein
MGLNPPAPDLTLSFVRRKSDGELYWIAAHGIRMTGMPAFLPTLTSDEIWKIVAFVRHMPAMTKEEQQALKADQELGVSRQNPICVAQAASLHS